MRPKWGGSVVSLMNSSLCLCLCLSERDHRKCCERGRVDRNPGILSEPRRAFRGWNAPDLTFREHYAYSSPPPLRIGSVWRSSAYTLHPPSAIAGPSISAPLLTEPPIRIWDLLCIKEIRWHMDSGRLLRCPRRLWVHSHSWDPAEAIFQATASFNSRRTFSFRRIILFRRIIKFN